MADAKNAQSNLWGADGIIANQPFFFSMPLFLLFKKILVGISGRTCGHDKSENVYGSGSNILS
jgi:hypothetical protein